MRGRGISRSCGEQGGGGVGGGVIEVDFFDEADGELVVDEEDLVAGVDARGAVLADTIGWAAARLMGGRIGGEPRPVLD